MLNDKNYGFKLLQEKLNLEELLDIQCLSNVFDSSIMT